MNQEIERKFLLCELPPGLGACEPVSIQQGYLMQCDAREARIRRKGSRWLLTVKDGFGLQRREVEIGLTEEQGRALWPLTEGRRVAKKRYAFPHVGYLLEVDIFEEPLAPLRLCEVEFDSIEAAQAFEPPAFLGREVTEAAGYKNANLALHGMPG